jgi:hypothetical protein
MMLQKEVMKWLKTIPEDSGIAIDDGGLALVELDADNDETDNYIEIGGIPQDEEEE